ncbi:hypothetical protein AB0M02_46660 [Actinoplanes sp. NPDC051861]|uniref:DUF6896 domain-containing protein n=1 Tax=Actinoplanes sp. NPDC051861 TaxID=3155170 RepID=UPI00342070C2
MTADDGREVDVDLVDDPATGEEVEAFDGWRVRWFIDEAADGGLQTADVTAACRYLAEVGELREVVPRRWFALVQD